MEPVQYPKHVPPSEEEQAAQRAELERMRAQWAEEARVNDHWKRFLLLAGPPLRDLEAAMACRDSCHPSIRMQSHDGGTTCHCQDTPEEAEQRRTEGMAAWVRLMSREPDPEAEAEAVFLRQSFERAAVELGVELKSWGGSVPFQIEAVVDGRSFYLRNRHQQFRIEVAPEDDPRMFVDSQAKHWDGQWLIDEGGEQTLFGGERQDEVYALKYVVAKVRAFLGGGMTTPCPHVFTNEAGTIQFVYCPLCGYLLQHLTGVRS